MCYLVWLLGKISPTFYSKISGKSIFVQWPGGRCCLEWNGTRADQINVRILQKRVTCSEREATQGVDFSECRKCLISIPKSVAAQERMLTCQNSRVAWFLGKGCPWPEKSPNPKPQRCLKVSLQWIASQAHQETVKGLSSGQKLAFCIFWRRRRWVILILNLDIF